MDHGFPPAAAQKVSCALQLQHANNSSCPITSPSHSPINKCPFINKLHASNTPVLMCIANASHSRPTALQLASLTLQLHCCWAFEQRHDCPISWHAVSAYTVTAAQYRAKMKASTPAPTNSALLDMSTVGSSNRLLLSACGHNTSLIYDAQSCDCGANCLLFLQQLRV